MNARLLIIYLALSSIAIAQAAFSLRPGNRTVADPSGILINPFVGPVDSLVIQDVDTGTAEPAGVRDLRAFVAANPVSAIAWTAKPEARSVLLGTDVILKIGTTIPRDYLEVGPSFTVTDIQQNLVTFTPLGRGDYPINFQANLRAELKSSLSTTMPGQAPTGRGADDRKYWLTEDGKRHNATCRFYNLGDGRAVNKGDGKGCDICGG